MITLRNPVDPNFTNEAVYNNPLLDQLRPVTIPDSQATPQNNAPPNTTNSENNNPPNDSTNITNSEAVPLENSENTEQVNGENTIQQVVHSEEAVEPEKEKEQNQVENPNTTVTNVTESTTLEEA